MFPIYMSNKYTVLLLVSTSVQEQAFYWLQVQLPPHYSPMVSLICPKITRNWRFRVSYQGNPEMEVLGTSLKRPTIDDYLMYPKVDIEDRKKIVG